MVGRSIDYEQRGSSYALHRRADPRIANRVRAALGDARTVVNVGAGAGSYEPDDRYVLAIEPSPAMRAQRPAHLAPAIAGEAEEVPLDDESVDAAMAVLTVHHWSDQVRGLSELRRVARGPVVVVTFDPDVLATFWLLADYLPEVIEDNRGRFPTLATLKRCLGGQVDVEPVPIPADCIDGFFEAYWARPEAYLEESVRAAQSSWPRLPTGVEARAVEALEHDLHSGVWDERHGHLRHQSSCDGGLVVVVARP